MKPKEEALSSSLRDFLAAVGQSLMPAGGVMPGYNEGSLRRFEGWYQTIEPRTAKALAWGYHALRRRIGGWFLPSTEKAWQAEIQRYLRDLPARSAFERHVWKAAAMPLKLAHYDSEDVYKAAGLSYPQRSPLSKGVGLGGAKKRQGLILDKGDLKELEEIEIDALVIGSGAGGAVIAHELAAAGWSVLIIEEGPYVERQAFQAKSPKSSLSLYRNQGMNFTLGSPPIVLPTGRSVGGTTTINSGTCYRPPERILAKWQAMGLTSWDLETLKPHLEKVEATLEVQTADPRFLGKSGQVIAAGCEAMGYTHGPLLRNTSSCDGQGVCVFGCPTEAKRSTDVSYIPLALQKGAFLAPKTRLLEIKSNVANKQRVCKVRLEHLETQTLFEISCKRLILAAGSLRTPLFLKGAGVKNRWLGRHLSIHPAASVLADIGEEDAEQRIPQGYAIDAFHQQGLLFEGSTLPLEIMAGASALWGNELQEQMASFRRLVSFGFLLEDEGKGRILGEIGDFPLIHYSITAQETKKIQKGMEILAGVYLAAGARQVWPQLLSPRSLRDFSELRSFAACSLDRSEFDLSAYHPLGTARMGCTANEGVVDPQGRVFGWENLYVADGSLLPTSPAVNPQITIMAAASYIAAQMIA